VVVSALVGRQWSDIRPGDFVQDEAGKTWKVEKRGILGEIHLIDQESVRVELGRMSGPVAFWDLSPEAEPLEGFRMALGARIVYDRH
jgi:hypothetical protein